MAKEFALGDGARDSSSTLAMTCEGPLRGDSADPGTTFWGDSVVPTFPFVTPSALTFIVSFSPLTLSFSPAILSFSPTALRALLIIGSAQPAAMTSARPPALSAQPVILTSALPVGLSARPAAFSAQPVTLRSTRPVVASTLPVNLSARPAAFSAQPVILRSTRPVVASTLPVNLSAQPAILTSALPVVISALPAILSIAAIAPSTLLVVLTGSERSQRRREIPVQTSGWRMEGLWRLTSRRLLPSRAR